MNTNVYVLQLIDNKYYVGSSKNIDKRYLQHTSGNGSAWTKKYSPLQIIERFENVDSFEETNITKKYMMTYGIDNVRGGAYCTIVLTNEELAIINKEIWSSQGCCVRCGRKGHFVTKCYAKTTIDGKSLVNITDPDIDKKIICTEPTHACDRCGRDTHKANVCKNKTHINGTRLDITDVKELSNLHCTRCGRNNHNNDKCYATTSNNGATLDNNVIIKVNSTNSNVLLCTKCGRDNHTIANCTSTTHIEGYWLQNCTRCGRNTHVSDNCFVTICNDLPLQVQPKKEDSCIIS